MIIKLLNWNIGGSNHNRFIHQAYEIEKLNCNILVLTEVRKNTQFKEYINLLEGLNYKVYHTDNFCDNYCVLICVKDSITSKKNELINYTVTSRNCIVNINLFGIDMSIVGTYFPSNDRRKIDKKKKHYEELINILKQLNKNVVLCGDFNSVYKNHVPNFNWFRQWEFNLFDDLENLNFKNLSVYNNTSSNYTWLGINGIGHVYDYIFYKGEEDRISFKLKNIIDLRKKGLSDHSALLLVMER